MEGPIGQQTISPLQLMQARFQRKLLQDKQEIMMQLYPGSNVNRNTGVDGVPKNRGGAVRQFFAQRRANNNNDDAELLNKTGIISLQQSFNSSWSSNTFNRNAPKQGSPVGWDKSYPLSPLDRDSSGGSSSGYDSGNAVGSPYLNTNVGNKKNQRSRTNYPSPAHKVTTLTKDGNTHNKATRRTPSLDRYAANGNNPRRFNQQTMRRSNSQILVTNNKEKENDGQIPNYRPPLMTQKKKPPLPSPPTVVPTPPPPSNKLKFDDVAVKSGPKNKKAVVPAIEPKDSSHHFTSKQTSSPKRQSSNVDPNLAECSICGRRFAKDRIGKHTAICEKTTSKKRKVFDPTKMRTQGTELEEYVRKSSAKSQPEPPQVKKDWRVKRNNFIEAIRQAKVVQKHVAAGGKVADLPPPPPMDTSDYVQCPYCERKFSEGAAERHIPKCQNIKSNKRAERK